MASGEQAGRWRPLGLGAAAMSAVALFAAMRAIEGSLQRLHAPGAAGIGWPGLRREVDTAFERWEQGKVALAPFAPLSPGRLIMLHVIVNIALLAAVVIVVRLLPDRFKGTWSTIFLVVAALAGAQILLEAAVGTGGCCRSTFGAVLQWVTWAVQGGALLVVLAFLGTNHEQLRNGFRAVRIVPASTRVALGVALLIFGVPQFGRIGSQIEDVLARTLVDRTAQLGWATLAAAAHVGAMWVLVSVRRRREGPVAALKSHELVVIGVLLALAGVIFKEAASPGGGFGLVVIGCIVAGLGMLAAVPATKEPTRGPDHGSEARIYADDRWDARVLAVATALPAFGLAVAAARLAASQASTDNGEPWQRSVGFAIVALGGAVVGATMVRRAGESAATRADERRATAAAGTPATGGDQASFDTSRKAEGRKTGSWVLAIAAAGVFALSPPLFVEYVDGDAWQAIGNLAILLSVAPMVAVLLVVARFVGGEMPPIHALQHVGIHRVPVLTLGVVAVLVASTLDVRSPYHDARVLLAESGAEAIAGPVPDTECADGSFRETAAHTELAGRFCTWYERATKAAEPTVELVLVVASGGGIRAAAWTGRVLDCVFFERDDSACSLARQDDALVWSDVFAMGGASGGSVGVASAVAEVIQNGEATADDNWARLSMGADFLAPLAGRVLLQQIPMAATGGYHGGDGARELEAAWGAAWNRTATGCEDEALHDQRIADIGFLALATGCRDLVPLLLLNGTNVRNGQRVNISPLDGDAEPDTGPDLEEGDPVLTPASNDIVDVLCRGEDIPLFTAAFMSARFPLVTPSAHLPQRADGKECKEDAEPIDVVDGGYYDNSGTSQVHEVWAALAPMVGHINTDDDDETPLIRPTLIVIETGEGVPVAGTQRAATPTPEGTELEEVAEPGGPFQIGEVLRPLTTALSARAGSDYFRAQLSASVAAFRAGGEAGRVVTFDLAEHPGRRLPLGWVLGAGSADDIDHQLQLCINIKAAASLGVVRNLDPDPCAELPPGVG